MSHSLFSLASFTSSAGLALTWKVECDHLTDDDWKCLAYIAVEERNLPPFREVYGIPGGGLKFQNALFKYRQAGGGILLADDVLTTGRAMERSKILLRADIGVVAFARNKCPEWVTPVWSLR